MPNAAVAPDDTIRFTVLLDATDVPAVGVWLITLPDGTVALVAIVTVPTRRPAEVMEVVAAACV